jgi:RNA polymerase sigma-70 factor, ECF subfamily
MITESGESGHGHSVSDGHAEPLARSAPRADEANLEPTFDEVYDQHFDFVWRNLRRLGVAEANLWDSAQDVFVVVHRRLADFELRGTVRAWLYSIVVRVARQARRTLRRKPLVGGDDLAELADVRELGPERCAERSESVEQLMALLDTLDEAKREAFVLSELEGLTAPEISTILRVNLNTIYARIRAARKQLEAAVAARQEGGLD